MSDIGNMQDKPGEKVIAHPMVGCLLTEKMMKEGYVFITFLCAIRLSKIIGKAKTDYPLLWNFQRAVLCSKAVTETLKEEFWMKDSLTDDIPSSMITDAKAALMDMIPTDLFKDIIYRMHQVRCDGWCGFPRVGIN